MSGIDFIIKTVIKRVINMVKFDKELQLIKVLAVYNGPSFI